MTTEPTAAPAAAPPAVWNNHRIHQVIKGYERGSRGLALGDGAELFVPKGAAEPTHIVQIRGRADRRDVVSFWVWRLMNEGKMASLAWSGGCGASGTLSLEEQPVLLGVNGVVLFERLMLAVLDMTFDWWEEPTYQRPIVFELSMHAERDARAALRARAEGEP